MAHNRAMALAARGLVLSIFGTEPLTPDSMVGSMAAMEIPRARTGSRVLTMQPKPPLNLHPLQVRLFEQHRIEIPVTPFPTGTRFNLRLSAAPHNEESDYRALVAALRSEGYGGG